MKKILFAFGASFLLLFGGGNAFAKNANDIVGETSSAAEMTKILDQQDTSFTPPARDDIDSSLRGNSLGFYTTVFDVIDSLFGFFGLIAVIVIIYFAFRFFTSYKENKGITKREKGILYVSIGIFLMLFSYIFAVFLLSPGSADAATRSETYPEEEEIYNRLDNLRDEMDMIKDFDVNQVLEWRQDFRDLLKNLPDSIYVQTIKNHLSDGDLTITKDILLKNFETFVSAQKAYENNTDDSQTKILLRSVSRIKSDIEKNIKNLKSKMQKIERMEAKISLKGDKNPVPLTVSFDGLKSEDPTNTTIPASNYSWSYVDIDGTEKDLGNGPNKTLILEKAGSYVLRLEVSSASQKDILPAIDYITIHAEPPVLKADFLMNGEKKGSVIRIPLKDAERGISFDPTPSVIPDGLEIVEYIWDFDGEKTSTGGSAEGVQHIFTTTGSHKVSLTVMDTTGKKDTKRINIDIQSSIAVIDMSNGTPMAGEVVVFDAQRSSLENAPPTQYDWKIFEKNMGLIAEFQNKPQFSHIFYDPGEYEIQLFIGGGVSSTRTFQVLSKPPFAAFITRVDDPSQPAHITFDASKSYDPEHQEIRYNWDFDGDGNYDIRNQKDPVVSYIYTKKSLFTPTLTVTDASGQSAQAVQNIRITSLFSVDFSTEKMAIQKDMPLVFRVETNEGTTFHWNFGDGTELDTEKLSQSHTYAHAGTFPVQLTAYDNNGNTLVVEKKIFVGDGNSPLPIIRVQHNGKDVPIVPDLCGTGKNGIEVYRYNLLSFSAENSINTRGGSDNLHFYWDFGNKETKESMNVEKKFINISTPGNCEKVILTARDEISGVSAESTPIYFFVRNALPTLSDIEVSPPAVPCTTPCSVSVKAKGVNDPDGQVQTYRWWATLQGDLEKEDLHTTSVPETTLTLPPWGLANAENTYLIFVELIDNDGGKVISEDILGAPIEVQTKNGEKTLYSPEFSADRTFLSVGESVRLSAKAQSGTILPNEAYLWDFNGDGEFDDTTSGPTVEHTFDAPGEYLVRLTIRYEGVADSSTQTIFVNEKQEFPRADFSTKIQGLLATFYGSLSEFDSTIENNSLSYAWDFDTKKDTDKNGKTDDDVDSTEENPTYIYDSVGEKMVKLTIKNALGKTNSITKKISVGGISNILSSNDIFMRSISLASNMPMAQLQIVIRKSTTDPLVPVEVIVYGFNSNGSLLSDTVNITVEKGKGNITGASSQMKNGIVRAFFTPSEKNETVVLRATAKSTSGLLSETIEF